MKPIVFIGGHPKSGTTLLLSLLDSDPNLCVFPEEIKFFWKEMQGSHKDKIEFLTTKSDAILPGKFNQLNPQSGFRDYSHIDSEKYTALLTNNLTNCKNDSDYLYAIFDTYSHFLSSKDFNYYVEKTPFNEFHLTSISELFPSHKIIHIIRDPRDNYLSYKKLHPHLNLLSFCTNWKKSTKIAIENASNPNYLTITYEDLVLNKSDTVNKLCKFLKIPFSDNLLIPTRSGSKWSGNSMFNANSSAEIHSNSVSRYQAKLDANDWCLIESYLYKELNLLNYEILKAKEQKSLLKAKFISKLKRIISN